MKPVYTYFRRPVVAGVGLGGLTLAIFAILYWSHTGMPWGQSVAGLQMAAVPTQSQVHTGEPVILDLYLRNTGKQPITLNHINSWMSYSVNMIGPDGNPATRTADGNSAMSEWEGYDLFPCQLDPGKQTQITMNVGRIFDMTRTGTYTIVISRSVPTGKGRWWSYFTTDLSASTTPTQVVVR